MGPKKKDWCGESNFDYECIHKNGNQNRKGFNTYICNLCQTDLYKKIRNRSRYHVLLT
jgi:hypothetical protein